MTFDIINTPVKHQGVQFIMNFKILSESREGKTRTLMVEGYDEAGGIYSATGSFNKDTYIFEPKNIERIN